VLFYRENNIFSEMIVYPDSKLIYSRSIYNVRKEFFTSSDTYQAINSWLELRLIGIPHEISNNQQEGNVDCTQRKWKQKNAETIVVVCNHDDNRTISTQVTVF
jgi:hypothetical protein